MRPPRLDRLKVSAAIAALGTVGATAFTLMGGMQTAAAASPPALISAVDCSQTYGGNYLATIDGQVNGTGTQATVTLGSNCTGTPYYLAVYEASDNLWGGGAYPNSQESFPEPQDYPEYIYPQSPTEKYVTFSSATPGGPLTATVNLPNSCWELDIFSFASVAGTIPDSFTAADGLGFPPGVWGENGPFTIASDGTATPASCTAGSTTTTTASTTTTTASTTTTTAPTTTTTAPTTTTTASTTTTTASTTTTMPTTTTTTKPPCNTTTTTKPPCPTTTTTKPPCNNGGDNWGGGGNWGGGDNWGAGGNWGGHDSWSGGSWGGGSWGWSFPCGGHDYFSWGW